MKIPAALQPLIDAARREPPSLLQQLKVGQTLPAKVLEQLQPGLLRLQLASTILLARSQVSLQAGTALRLEVTKPFPLPELRILQEATPRERQQHAVRSAMARQLPPADVRQAATGLGVRTTSPRLAEGVRQFSAITADSGIRLSQLAPAQIQRALHHSGILHEARMAANLPHDPGDTKTRLLQLLTLLRPDPKAEQQQAARNLEHAADQNQAGRSAGADSLLNRLVRLIEGSISRIQLQQAAVLPQEEGQRQAWQIDLPIHLPDETQDAMLRIEREAAQDGKPGDATWAVNLAFQFDSIGTLQCRMALAGERLSTTFWCERDATFEKVERRLPALRKAFEAQGFEVVHLAGVLGDPPEPLIHVPMPDSLLDERA